MSDFTSYFIITHKIQLPNHPPHLLMQVLHHNLFIVHHFHLRVPPLLNIHHVATSLAFLVIHEVITFE